MAAPCLSVNRHIVAIPALTPEERLVPSSVERYNDTKGFMLCNGATRRGEYYFSAVQKATWM
jgi:hypothetical protein